MAEPSASDSSPETDRDFDPTAEMLVNDFDDERTLDEEEAMESGEDVQNELDELQKEGDMPLEDLLVMYGYGDGNQADTTQSSSSEEILSNQDLTLDKDEIARDLLPDVDEEKNSTVNELIDNMDAIVPTSRLLRSAVPHHQSESESESEDEDYIPDDDDDWKKTIQVGSDFQAAIPDGLCKYDDAPAYENDDKLLWDPSKLLDEEVDDYLRKVQQPNYSSSQGVNAVPTGAHVRDDEQALYLLLQCGHNIEEAQRRRRMQPVLPTDTMSLWSEEECRSFENGLRSYGKDFHLIQQNKVKTRSVGELVQFYYLWKKTERHDVFANKARLEKKKYTLHPGTTDYMDRFLDEHENPSVSHRDRSSSPNIHSLIAGDHKRQQHHNRSLNSSLAIGSSNEINPTTSHHFIAEMHQPISTAMPTSSFAVQPEFVNPTIVSHASHVPSETASDVATGNCLIETSEIKNGLPSNLEDLAKNLSQHGLDRESLESLTSGFSNSSFPSHPDLTLNSHHSMGSLKNIEMSIASVNSLASSVQSSASIHSLATETIMQPTAGPVAQ